MKAKAATVFEAPSPSHPGHTFYQSAVGLEICALGQILKELSFMTLFVCLNCLF